MMLRTILTVAVLFVSGAVDAQDAWRAGPGYPLPPQPTCQIRQIWIQQPEYVYRPGYITTEYVPTGYGYYEPMRVWHPSGRQFTGRVTWQWETWRFCSGPGWTRQTRLGP